MTIQRMCYRIEVKIMSVELKIGDILLLPLIVSVVEGLKTLGLPVSYARLVTGILSVAAYGLMLFIQAYPEYQGYVVTVLGMLALFLGSTGLYSGLKSGVAALRG